MDHKSEKKESQNTLYQAIIPAIKGGFAGATEVAVDHPLWTLKTRYQDKGIPQSEKFTANPKALYRGVVPNMLSMIPITALQVSCTEGVKTIIKKEKQEEDDGMSALIDLFASCMGGALSAVVSSPTELIMVKQKAAQGFISTASDIVSKKGIRGLTTGLGGTSIRDAVFTGGYLFGVPYLKNQLTPYFSEKTSTAMSGITAGVSAAMLSHPFDTIKTAQQTAKENVMPMFNTAKNLMKQEGIKGFYNGGCFRTLRVISAVTLMSTVNETIDSCLGGNKNRS